jgi:hypothetical protein
MYDFDDIANELCMTADIPIKDISFEAKDFPMSGTPGYEDVAVISPPPCGQRFRVSFQDCTLCLRRVAAVAGVKKNIFLIRHGESKWNEAQVSHRHRHHRHRLHGCRRKARTSPACCTSTTVCRRRAALRCAGRAGLVVSSLKPAPGLNKQGIEQAKSLNSAWKAKSAEGSLVCRRRRLQAAPTPEIRAVTSRTQLRQC